MKAHKYFAGKTVVITGGSSGIGYALAERIASFHPRALVLISHEWEKLQKAKDQLQKQVTHTVIGQYVADIADSQSTGNVCKEIIAEFGVPDILVNNAGYSHYFLFKDMSEEEIVRHADVNFIGAMRVTHAFLPGMLALKRGQIVNVTSIAAHMVVSPNLVYCAAKHGMVAWSEGLATELMADGITVQSISPGRVMTDFFRHESFQTRRAGAETQLTVPLKKVIDVSIRAIIKKKKHTIVPAYWLVITWTINTFPFIVKPLLHVLLRRRFRSLIRADS